MKMTGIIRRIDELGRIVIPKEIRKNLRIKNGESLEIFVDDEDIILKRYSPVESLDTIALKFVNTFNQVIKHNVIVTDRNKVIAIAGPLKKKYLDKDSGKMLAIVAGFLSSLLTTVCPSLFLI